jgi:hypothetical protein
MFKKKVILIIGLMIPLLGLLYNIYANYNNNRITQINFLNSKLDERKREIKTPLIYVQINTLEMSGLPTEILNALPIIPSTIEIENIRGESAKDITLDIFSSVPINKFNKWETVENFSISFLDKSKKRLKINIPQLRSGTEIGVTFLTSQIPNYDFKFFADKGELFDLDKESQKRDETINFLKNELGSNYVYMSSLRRISIENYWLVTSASKSNLALEIELLEKKINELKKDNMAKALFRFFIERPKLLFAFMLIITISYMLVSAVYLDNKKNKWKYSALLKIVKKNEIKNGDSIFKILELFGTPSNITIPDINEIFDLELKYSYSTYKLFRKKFFLVFKFKDFKLIRIEGIDN